MDQKENVNSDREKFLKNIDARNVINTKTRINQENPNHNQNKDGTNRNHVMPGIKVKIVQKHHQKTGELTEGIVKDILTNSKNHHRGIKVRLTSGIVGRIQQIL